MLLLQIWGGSFILSLGGVIFYFLLGLQNSSMPPFFHAAFSILMGLMGLLLYVALGYIVNDGRMKATKAALSICSLSLALMMSHLYLIIAQGSSAAESGLFIIFHYLVLWLNSFCVLIWDSFGYSPVSPASLLMALLPSLFICLGYLVKGRSMLSAREHGEE